MNINELARLREWFSAYVKGFYREEDPVWQKNIRLKEEHTFNVCRDIVLIAREHQTVPEDVLVAESAALFHDLGRFPQYARYRTFRDAVSVNHGELGARILAEEAILRRQTSLSAGEQALITDVVKYHNAFSLAGLKDPRRVFFLRLLRDADKLDIWRVFIEYFNEASDERASAPGLGLPEGGHSEEALSALFHGSVISLARVKSMDDYKCLLLSWIYDLNFRAAYRLVAERGIVEAFIKLLPETEEIKKARLHLLEFIRGKLSA